MLRSRPRRVRVTRELGGVKKFLFFFLSNCLVIVFTLRLVQTLAKIRNEPENNALNLCIVVVVIVWHCVLK